MGKMNSFQGSVACFILKALAMFLCFLPMPASLWLGRRLGELVSVLGAKNRRKVCNNLKIAFGSIKTSEEIEGMVRNFYHLYGQNIVELARLPLIARKGFDQYVEVHGREHVDAAMKKGKGLIFLSMHSGNWELSNIVGSMSGYPYSMVANYLGQINKVADYLDSLRQSAGSRIINPGLGGREIIKRLKHNEIVTLVADQGGSDGVFVSFFGREASMSTGAVRLALKYGAAICLVDVHRTGPGKHYLVAHPFDVEDTGDLEQDVRSNMQKIASWFQARIEEHPSEYIWSYGTWKYSMARHVVILDDGRTGHLRQSQAVARHMRTALEERGRKVSLQTVSVEYKSAGHAVLLQVFTAIGAIFTRQNKGLLKFCLTEKTFEGLARIKADYVISCGARNAPVNVWFSRESDAVNLAILRPGFVPYWCFDRVILPDHDNKKRGAAMPRVLLTKAAPNLIGKDYLQDNKARLLERFPDLRTKKAPRIGLLVGGDTKGLVLGESQMRSVFQQIKNAAREQGADILITTSRRTSLAVDTLTEKEFQGDGRAALVIIANRSNAPEAVGGILALADVLVVSGESISMVSEAASSGKTTIVFPVDGEDGRAVKNKYSAFVGKLADEGHVIFAQTQGLGQVVEDALTGKRQTRPLQDGDSILLALRKMVV